MSRCIRDLLAGLIVAAIAASAGAMDIHESLHAYQEDGVSVSYRIIHPNPLPTDRLFPVIWSFHGSWDLQPEQDATQAMTPHLRAALEATGLAKDFIVIAPRAQRFGWARYHEPLGAEWNTEHDMRALKALQAHLHGKYPIDPRRILVTGRSNGSLWITNAWLAENRETIAGVMGWTTGYDRKGLSYFPTTEYLPAVNWKTGTHDSEIGPYNTSFLVSMRRAGFPFLSHVADGGTHASVHEIPGFYEDHVQWAYAVRNQGVAPNAVDSESLAAMIGRNNLDTADFALIARVGGRHASPAVVHAMKSPRPIERAAAVETLSVTLFDHNAVWAAVELLGDGDRSVRESALFALSRQARWGQSEAFDALVEHALNRSLTISERVVAIKAIGYGLHILVQCDSSEYPRPLWALLDLMQDSELVLRNAAAKALSSGNLLPSFGYAANGTEEDRRATMASWTNFIRYKAGDRPGTIELESARFTGRSDEPVAVIRVTRTGSTSRPAYVTIETGGVRQPKRRTIYWPAGEGGSRAYTVATSFVRENFPSGEVPIVLHTVVGGSYLGPARTATLRVE